MIFSWSWGKNIDRGQNATITFLTLLEDKDFWVEYILKRPWEETWFLMKVSGSKKIINGINQVQNGTYLGFGMILKRIEDVYIFQNVKLTIPASYNAIKECYLFQKNPLVKSVRNVIKHNPFLVILTNEQSKNNNKKFVNKYCFSRVFVKDPNENKTVIVSVGEDEVENIILRDGLLNNYYKLLFLKHMDNPKILNSLDMGTVLDILGFPLHSIHYSNEEVVLFYGDDLICPHEIPQKIQMVLYFNKNLNLKNANILEKTICERCLYAKKISTNKQKKRKQILDEAMAYSGTKADLNSFLSLGYSVQYFNNYNVTPSIKKYKYTESLEIAKEIYKDEPRKYPWEYYKDLLDLFFLTEEKIPLEKIFLIFDESDFNSSEFYTKADFEVVKG
jgi:hypothetical protein